MNNDKVRREALSERYTYNKSRATISREAKDASQKKSRAKSEDYFELGSATQDNDKDDIVYSGREILTRRVDVSPESHNHSMKMNHEWDAESQTSQTKIIRKTTTLTLTGMPRALDGRLS